MSGVEIRQDGAVDADASLDDPTWAPSKLHRELFSSDRLGRELVHAVLDIADGRTASEFRQHLEEIGVDALDGLYADLCVRVAREGGEAAFELIRATRQIGTGQTSYDLRSGREDLRGGALPILREAEVTPTIAITIGERFTDSNETRAGHRRESLALIRELGDSCDVTLVAGQIEQTFLWYNHRDELPASVEATCNPHQGSSPVAAELEAGVTEAREALANSPQPKRILELIGEQEADVLTYTRATNELPIGRGTVRGHAKTLRDLDLVSTIEWYGETAITLTPTGIAFVEAREAEIGRQGDLESCVERTGKSCFYSRVSPQHERGDGDGPRDRRRVGELIKPTYYDRWRHAAVAGCANEGGITLVDQPEKQADERRQPYWSYDPDADRMVVGAEYDNPMQYWTCIARALASTKTFDQALTPERLDGDVGSLGGLMTDDLRILRDARCLGYLSDADANGEDYVDALREAEIDLCRLSTAVCQGDVSRGEQTRAALGLASTMIHLLELAGIEVVRELRLPEFTRHFSAKRRNALKKTIGIGASIQSRIGHFTAYRQLFEDDDGKRAASMEPEIPADDPHGRMIGSFVIVGNNVSSFEEELTEHLRGPEEIHEDAPEFDVPLPVRSNPGRPAYAQAVRETLAGKNLSATREAVSIIMSLTGTPYDAAQSIGHGLAPEEKYPGREIRINETRAALRLGLEDSRILPNAAPSLGAIVSALLTATEPVSQAEIAERADVTARSIRTHAPALEALGLLSETPEGYRLEIAFDDEDDSVIPSPVADSLTDPEDPLFDALYALLGDDLVVPGHPIGEAFWTDDPIGELLETNPELAPWIEIAVGLAGPDEDSPARIVRFGKTPQQTSITEVGA